MPQIEYASLDELQTQVDRMQKAGITLVPFDSPSDGYQGFIEVNEPDDKVSSEHIVYFWPKDAVRSRVTHTDLNALLEAIAPKTGRERICSDDPRKLILGFAVYDANANTIETHQIRLIDVKASSRATEFLALRDEIRFRSPLKDILAPRDSQAVRNAKAVLREIDRTRQLGQTTMLVRAIESAEKGRLVVGHHEVQRIIKCDASITLAQLTDRRHAGRSPEPLLFDTTAITGLLSPLLQELEKAKKDLAAADLDDRYQRLASDLLG